MKTVRGLFEKYWRSSDEEEHRERNTLAGLWCQRKVNQLFAETAVLLWLAAIFGNYHGAMGLKIDPKGAVTLTGRNDPSFCGMYSLLV